MIEVVFSSRVSLLAFFKATTFSFSFPGMRSSFIRLFPHGQCYSLRFKLLLLYTRNFTWYNSFSFSPSFCVPASSLLFCHYYRCFLSLYYHTFYCKLCFSFSGIRRSLFVCSLMADVIHCIFATFYTTEFTWFNSFGFSLYF